MEFGIDYGDLVTRQNADDIGADLAWFESVLNLRSAINAGSVSPLTQISDIQPPNLSFSNSPYAIFVQDYATDFDERFMLFLSMVPHIKPESLDLLLVQNTGTGQIYTEFGGKKGKVFNGFLPTMETLMFVLATGDLNRRFELMRLLDSTHPFWKLKVLGTEVADSAEPITALPLIINKSYLELFTTGKSSIPHYSQDFPAKQLITPMEWSDLVLSATTQQQLNHIETWLGFNDILMNDWEMSKKIKPGYKALFHGPSGTGKSLVSALLGKRFNKPVFRVDLSKVVSKYIGETSKNMSNIFDQAESRQWILFFDEADSLFGKRTQVNDSHDRYANQETSFLLQRIEDYDGLVILASNFRHNMDEAFIRRFQAVVEFSVPGPDERLKLWNQGFSGKSVFEEKLDLAEFARKYEITGGLIMNIIHFSSLQALRRGSFTIKRTDILDGIKRELQKSGRTI